MFSALTAPNSFNAGAATVENAKTNKQEKNV